MHIQNDDQLMNEIQLWNINITTKNDIRAF